MQNNSGFIITYIEEEKIRACLASLHYADDNSIPTDLFSAGKKNKTLQQAVCKVAPAVISKRWPPKKICGTKYPGNSIFNPDRSDYLSESLQALLLQTKNWYS